MSPAQDISAIIQEWSQVFMHRSGRDFYQFMQKTGLSFSQVHILMSLFHGKPCGVSAVGEEMGVTNAAASQAVERLVQMGLLHRSEDPGDRRSKRLGLTDAGYELIQSGIKARSQWMTDIANNLDNDQKTAIIKTLTLLTKMAREDKN